MTIDEAMEIYRKTFDEGFPMYQLGRCRADDEIIEIIERCLDEQKDAYELGLIDDGEDVLY